MTDITDQDRRDAREWAEDVAETFKYDDEVPRETRAAVNYILATVDAPEPTLAEELRDVADNYGMSSRAAWRLDDIADRMERDLTEARAEVERLTAERITDPSPTLNDPSMTRPATVVREENVAPDLPDPADVPAGEAWIVETGGQTITACRLHPTGSRPWIVPVRTLGSLPFHWVSDSDITLVSRLVPAPRQVTTREELDALPRRTVIRDKDGVVCERTSLGEGWYSPESTTDQTHYITFPATVLWTPEETA